jgi:hypothetical protein
VSGYDFPDLVDDTNDHANLRDILQAASSSSSSSSASEFAVSSPPLKPSGLKLAIKRLVRSMHLALLG